MLHQSILIFVLFLSSIPFAPKPALAQYVSCESERGKTNRCRIDARNGVRLVRERSQTPCDGNWSYRDGYITVRNGCRGDFEAIRRNNNNNDDWGNSGSGNRQRVTCESVHNNKKSCPINTRGGVRLVEELSSASCRNNWTADGGYVTVRNGCRGVFESRNSGGSGGSSRYREFGNIAGLGYFVVDRSSYYRNGSVQEFDAIVNNNRERWWVNCRNGVLGQGNDFDYSSRSSRNQSPRQIVDFVCSDRY
ncbi:hypothetical protein C7H19_20340 [Aphanothece hegewaldii CCALA 016]|uniref:DUF3011 domain-containing protein n=1 Tax=Aphanothece hegewaldii CCALA 016 TaxID=2107694 RepID=A0A2T1LSS8_9CHRO|nr:DUF3011 domain-containing protein [Aphanothece hegewaldii]PSF33157.1 hypothetical protein C7H19_20340 [Aphanothece hegewaldii CCALA 016]